MAKIAGIDVGGTFTDLILIDEVTGEVRLAKVPTTADNQAFGVMAALEQTGATLAELSAIVHGTTTTTNAMLERKIAKVGLITTRGFRDVLELGRRTRPTAYGLTGRFVPLIPRELRLEVTERMDCDGEVVTALEEAEVAEAAKKLIAMFCTDTGIPRTRNARLKSCAACGPIVTSPQATPSFPSTANTNGG